MTPYASLKIIEGYRERLYDQRDTATIGAYQGEYLHRVERMPPIEELLIDRKRIPVSPEQTQKEISTTIRAWLINSGRPIRKEEAN